MTLHVYGGPLERYTSYQPDSQGAYQPWLTPAKLDDVWATGDPA